MVTTSHGGGAGSGTGVSKAQRVLERMDLGTAVRALIEYYPRIYFACHVRHVRDRTGRKLSAHQASILDHLDTVAGTGLSELALHMGVTPSTMSLAIDRLEREGYVRRSRDRRDGRRVELRLTPKGAQIKERDKVLDPELVRTMLSTLTAEGRARAIGGLELLARAASTAMYIKQSRTASFRHRNPDAE
ncbi:MAG TPA: MarR family winged helix-turn-helix transcriptional regulator [Gemmatimonadales bacterium]|nr:MarR family winged helix-turn-helix transcriptional regulator [Gemmatimonadales bacterium]